MILGWLLLAVLLLIIESMTLGLTTIWFAAGAVVAFIAALLGVNIFFQVVCCFVTSFVLLIVTRPLAFKYLNRTITKTNIDAVIGKTARVVYPVNNVKGTGRVLVGHMEWAAKSSDDLAAFKRDDLVIVERIEGVCLVVKKMDINDKKDKENRGGKEKNITVSMFLRKNKDKKKKAVPTCLILNDKCKYPMSVSCEQCYIKQEIEKESGENVR